MQNSKFFTDGNDLGDPDAPRVRPADRRGLPGGGSVIDGVYSSSDFGKTWSVMEGRDQFATDVTSGSSLTQLRPLGISAGYQATYNEWIKVDPTQQDGSGTPTTCCSAWRRSGRTGSPASRWTARPSSRRSLRTTRPAPACWCCWRRRARRPAGQPNGYTTHPDQHGGILLPAKTGVDLIAGNDGGNYVQHSDSGQFSRNSWGAGNQGGFHTLLPYGVAMAKDRTVWAGLQDNGEMRIDGQTGVQNEVYGGDGVFTLVNPDNANEVIEEYPGATISVSKDGGVSWSDMSPFVDDADFVTPLVQDTDNDKHVVTGGRQIVETTSWLDTTGNCSKAPGEASPDPTCQDTDTDWKVVFDLGTQKNPGAPDAVASKDDPGNRRGRTAVARRQRLRRLLRIV